MSLRGSGPLPEDEFRAIYSKVPRLCVDIIVRNARGAVYLTKRAQQPCQGQWHLPGGTVFFGERLEQTVRRVAKRELSIDVTRSERRGIIEYPSHFENGLDSPVAVVFEAVEYVGEPVHGAEALDGGWYTTLPDPMHQDQDEFLLEAGYVTSGT